MNRATRMLLLNSGKDKETRRRRMGVEYEDWTPVDHYGPYMPTTYDDRPMEPESAFYDRRGRRHYDNGRFAPMSAYGRPMDAYDEPMDAYGEPESRRRYRRYSDGRFAPRSYMPMEPWGEGGSDGRMERGRRGGDRGPRMIGFGREWGDEDMRSDATMPRYQEMDQMHGRRDQAGMAYGSALPRFDQRMAMEWTRGIKNADGTKGPHWPLEKTKEIMKQFNIDCDPMEFYAVINSIYSDYCEALKKNNASTLETYACLAKAWLEDDDAVEDKAAAYFTYIIER